MSVTRGDKIHTHDGKVHRVRKTNQLPKMGGAQERGRIRGFVRVALVDEISGAQEVGDWWENTITYVGHQAAIRNFAGLASSASTVAATVITDLQLARYVGIGNHTGASAASDLSALSVITGSEWGTNSGSGANVGTRAAWTENGGTQQLSGTYSLTQTHAYAATHISHAATVNCIAQYAHATVSSGGALSIAMFNSSTKGTTQALNATYVFAFST